MTMKRPILLTLWISGVLFTACGPHFDRTSADHFSELKTYHLSFIDRFTGTTGRTFDASELRSARDQGARKFDTAREYMESKGDKKRLKALTTLREQFDKDCRFLDSVEKLFSVSYATQHKTALAANYDHAIAAEYTSVREIEE
jgi:hypothetical protein